MASKKYQITQLQEDNYLLVLHPETVVDLVIENDNKQFISSEGKLKLKGIQTGAQVNKIEKIKVNGVEQTITSKSVDIKIDTTSYVPVSQKGQANGVATLGGDGLVPASQLPSYVDDVLEFANKTGFPEKGETGKIYVAQDTNLTYRWSGTAYVEISKSLALGTTSSTAFPGNRGASLETNYGTLTTRVSAVEAKNTSQDTKITEIVNGTTKVGSASKADHATSSTSAGTATKLVSQRNIYLKNDILCTIQGFDGSADINAQATLKSVGTAGTYSVVTTDTKGRVINGAQLIEVGTSGQTTPSTSLAIGGIFYKEIA